MDPPLRERIRPFRTAITVLLVTLLLLWGVRSALTHPPRSVPYSELVTMVDEGAVEQADVHPDEVVVTLKGKDGKPSEGVVVARPPDVELSGLVDAMNKHGVKVVGVPEHASGFSTVLWIGFALLVPLLFWGLAGLGNAVRNQPMTFGRSKAKLYDKSGENKTTFADVAGVDEAKGELMEVVRFLKEPDRYRAVGARIPKGVLLVGAPGTGKTLLARAVAGESGVPFFTMSGSEFVEMFVGVGASRVRDLFEQAKLRAPCIIFIDELDAVGKSRAGPQQYVGNDEREQTLNQLLVEMDGFDASSGLVIMAATNRPEILDRALLRAGRFDRQVLVDRPDVRGRAAILAVHAKKVRIGPDVDLEIIAQRTPGMVGADLATVVNEAALASIRRNAEIVGAVDFEEAIDRIQLGLKKEGRVMTPDEKRRVAFHEAGHALVAETVATGDPVHRVTIIPRSIGALGATLQLPTQERWLMTRTELRDRICIMLGGRGAESVACGDVSTGAEDDLERATELARMMVARFGMSEAIGPVSVAEAPSARHLGFQSGRGNASDDTARLVDREVKSILDAEQKRANACLVERRTTLDAIANELLVHETLERATLQKLVGPRE
jgi:cell division protease FtsH